MRASEGIYYKSAFVRVNKISLGTTLEHDRKLKLCINVPLTSVEPLYVKL